MSAHVVGNPQAGRIAQFATLAYQAHGASVQGMLWFYCASPYVGRSTFWREALVDRCGVNPLLACDLTQDLERAARSATRNRILGVAS